ncbi:MAG: hypothetical protein AAFP90_08000 [Planctomycetota bacterium]
MMITVQQWTAFAQAMENEDWGKAWQIAEPTLALVNGDELFDVEPFRISDHNGEHAKNSEAKFTKVMIATTLLQFEKFLRFKNGVAEPPAGVIFHVLSVCG